MAEETSEELVLSERDGAVAVLTLNRPQARNAMTTDMLHTMGRLLDEIEADPDIRAVVLASAKPGTFIAGANVEPQTIHRLVHSVDVAPTLAAFLGIKPPSSAVGQPLQEVHP